MEIKQISIQKIKPYKNNAKKHTPEQVQAIANSIAKFGFVQPIVIDKNNEIVIGHGRYAAALSLGLDKVPCVKADDLTEDQITALRITDNKTNESQWDLETLSQEIGSIPDIEFTEYNFGEFELMMLDTEEDTEYEAEEVIKKERNQNEGRIIIIIHGEKEEEYIKSLFSIEDIKLAYKAQDLMKGGRQ